MTVFGAGMVHQTGLWVCSGSPRTSSSRWPFISRPEKIDDARETDFHSFARLRPVGFVQLTLFLGIILLATPLRQERWVFWVLLQVMFLDAVLVSLSASATRPGLRRAFFGVWAAGFGANLGATLASSVEGPLVEFTTLSLVFVLLSGCIVVVLANIFRRQRVTLDVMFAAVTVYLRIAFSFAMIYNIALSVVPRSFWFPEWIDPGAPSRSCARRCSTSVWSPSLPWAMATFSPAPPLPRCWPCWRR